MYARPRGVGSCWEEVIAFADEMKKSGGFRQGTTNDDRFPFYPVCNSLQGLSACVSGFHALRGRGKVPFLRSSLISTGKGMPGCHASGPGVYIGIFF